MESYQAMANCIGKDAEVVADVLGYKPITVRRWKQNPADSGSRNPLDVIRDTIQTAFDAGRLKADALAPLSYLESCFEGIRSSGAGLHESYANFIQEFGHYAKEYADAIRDRKITPDERRRLSREIAHMTSELKDMERILNDMAMED